MTNTSSAVIAIVRVDYKKKNYKLFKRNVSNHINDTNEYKTINYSDVMKLSIDA